MKYAAAIAIDHFWYDKYLYNEAIHENDEGEGDNER
jgi:hypothetical protein